MSDLGDSPVNVVMTDRVTEIKCKQCGCEIDVADLDPFVMVECPDCGNIETVPSRLGPFLLLNLIGRGGMGGVYQAVDESLGRRVAIKVMLSSLGANKQFVDTFRREAQAVAKLNHPSIVQIYSFGQEKGQPYIVMELVSGQRFDKMVDSGESLDQSLVMQVGLDVAEGLAAADEIGLLHGDVKPENILLDEKMKAKLVDFGLATFAHQDEPDGIWGTPYYIAPEKVQRKKPDARSDIYSLGATLYHALAGRPPFEGQTPIDVVKARLERPAPPLRQFRKDLDKQVETIVMRMLEAQPAKRHPTYASLIGDLQKVVKALGPARKGPVGPVTARITIRKKRSAPITVDMGTTSPPDRPEPPAGPQPTARVLIKKKRDNAPATNVGLDRYKTKITGIPTNATGTHQPAATKPSKPRKSPVMGVLWTLLVLLLIGGGIAGFVHWKLQRDRLIEDRREQFALAEKRTEAESLYKDIQAACTNALGAVSVIDQTFARITNAYFTVLGESLTPPPEPPPGATPAAPPDATATNEPPAAAADAPPAGEPQPAEPEPAATSEPEPEIKVAAMKTLKQATHANEIRLSLLAFSDTAGQIRTKALRELTSVGATGQVRDLRKLKDELAVTTDELAGVQKEFDRHAQSVFKIAEREIQQRDAQRRTIEEQERAEREEAERLRLEQERLTQVENEKQMVEATRTANMPMFRQNKFDEIATIIKGQLRDYKTDEGREAAQFLMERYQRLHGQKQFLIEQLNADKFTWGWVRAPGSKEDVLGADMEGVQLQGRKVPWTEVSIPQWMMFVRRYLDSRKVRVRQQGEQNLASAIFCFEHGQLDAARIFAQKAVEITPDLQDTVKRLLPLSD